MTQHNRLDALFDGQDPVAPRSVPPDVNQLQQLVWKRRRRRKIIGTSVIGGTLSCLFALVLWRTESVSEANMAVGNATTVQRDDSMPQRSPISLASNEPAGVRVFAKVWRQIPIFGLEEETQYLRHVGWIDSEEMVPVDLSQFSSEQQKSIEAVLDDNDSDEYFNL